MSVIVVGSGPTGLMLAGDLAEAGVDVTILERRAEESNLTRAFAVHARSLELLEVRGIADELVEQGFTVPELRASFGTRGFSVDISRLDSRYPYVLMVQQARTEILLRRRVERLGVPIVRGAEVIGLTQDGDGVTLTVRTAEGEHTERADHVVGTDGAHSAVRGLIGVPFTGRRYQTHIMIADVRLDNDLPNAVNPFIAADGFALLPPFGDGWFRAVVWDRTREEAPLTEPVTEGELNASLHRLTRGRVRAADMRWSTRFLSERRQAKHYRVGRVLLAGDAAHVHSPIGGMGMNTGLQDAANLGWKLAAVERGWAPSWLLDSYEAERHPVGRATLRLTDTVTRMVVASGPVRALRPYVVPRLVANERVSRAVLGMMSGIGFSYDLPDTLVGSTGAGERVPDLELRVDGAPTRLFALMDAVRFTLVDTSPNGAAATAAEPWGERVHAVRAEGALPHGADALLVRPDGHTAWSGRASGSDDLTRVLTEWAGTAPAFR
ncbi:FAD-dependent monooxygenase [Nocardiopsis lucentensis]|uniref:FAD-dependent monooxygenase n=1 Tax=Nocardiopsis lucentensis TaxID=53441 RepID=UPI0003499902|nr:FAD-dependent monooxygenase [Nocardiopsis lucentensis]